MVVPVMGEVVDMGITAVIELLVRFFLTLTLC